MHTTHYIRTIGAVLLALLISIFPPFSPPQLTHAETRITQSSISKDNVWSKGNNPYILEESVSLSKDQSLTIHPGVIIMSASSTRYGYPNSLFAYGILDVRGTAEEPVGFHGVRYVTVYSTTTIHFANFDASMLWTVTGTTTIKNSKFQNSTTSAAYLIYEGYVAMTDSEVSGNKTGILTSPNSTIYDTRGATITVRNSVFERNTGYSINNQNRRTIDALHNWWGRPEGPTSGKVTMNVMVYPVLTADPRIKKPECCSNVLFIPGFQASRLYRDDPDLLGSGTTTHRAWEPYTNSDARSLFLDNAGASVNGTIRTKDIIASAYGIKGIYNKFVAMMNGVVAEKKIREWKPFAYDWRLSPMEFAQPLVNEVERLALSSKSGKVTVIAHSNGGLLAKMLGTELEKIGKGSLVDKVVLVAVPALGTPQAIAGMLHGDSQDIGFGVILKSAVARTFGLNMIGAYGLLPSPQYFNRIAQPVITIAGKHIDSYAAFADFLTGKLDGRNQPAEDDVKTPAVLSPHLLSISNSMHSLVDSWNFPTTTQTISLAGWGMPTTQTIEYSSTSPRIKKNSEGDGTVAWGSSMGNVFFNQGLYNRDEKQKTALTIGSAGNGLTAITHANILEAAPVLNLLSDITSTSSLDFALTSSPPYLTSHKPNAAEYPWMKWYTVSMHSPVDVDIYDSKGGHMGMVPVPGSPAGSDVMMFENTIGGHFDIIGEEKYFTIPADDVYAIKLKGTGIGTFTYRIQKFVGGEMTEASSVVYADLPVTPLLVASTTLSSVVTTAPLHLDIDGNGTIDMQVSPKPMMDPNTHLDAMETIIRSSGLSSASEKKFLNRIEKARKIVAKDKDSAIRKIKAIADKALDAHWDPETLAQKDRELLLSTFEALLASLESSN